MNTPVLDKIGEEVGKVSDVLISQGEIFPRVCAWEVRKGKEFRLIPKDEIDYFSKRVIALTIQQDKIVLYEPSSRDLFLVKDLLDRQIIDIHGAKVVRVNDLKLMRLNHDFHLAGADIGLSGLIRRLNLEGPVKTILGLLRKPHPEQVVAWNFVELIPGEKPKVKLTVEQNKINQLHPADIAEILTSLSPQDRAVVMEALDEEKAASALGEVETGITLDILGDLSKEKVAAILKEMNPDDAADILGELPKEKVTEILSTLELREAADLENLLKHPENTAGGLMTTEFISLSEKLTVEQTIQYLREKAPDAETIYYLYVVDDEDQVIGVVSLRDLIVAKPTTLLSAIMAAKLVKVHSSASKEEVAELIAKYDLLAVPVVDESERLIGIITVDDVVDILLSRRWKRKKGG